MLGFDKNQNRYESISFSIQNIEKEFFFESFLRAFFLAHEYLRIRIFLPQIIFL